MMLRRPWVSPLLAASLALAIFAFDTISPVGFAVAVLYVLVILLSMGFAGRRFLPLVGAGCAVLTLLSFAISHSTELTGAPALRALVSLSAIAITTLLALRNLTATQVLRQSERRYRNIFKATAVAIWEEDLSAVQPLFERLRQQGVTDMRAHVLAHPDFVQDCIAALRIVDVNEAAVALVGAQSKQAFMGALDTVFLPETLDSFREFLLAFESGQPHFRTETVIRTLAGETRSVLMAVSFPTERIAHEHVLVSLLDITERLAAERALEQSRAELAHIARVVTLGELTASIAHEVSQPLTAVVTNGEASIRWLRRPVPDLVEAQACLEDVVSAGRHAAEVVQRIRRIARRSDPERARVDLNALIEDTLGLMRSDLVARGVAPVLRLDTALPVVEADRVQIQQVLINLLVNAAQAMEAMPERSLVVQTRQQGDLAMVSVQDSGPGLGEAALSKLFAAFFTTKPDGMGMGLSICRSIIEAHGGRIWATSEPGQGAIFQFSLPAGASAA